MKTRRSYLAIVSGLFLIGFCLFFIALTIACYLDPPSGPYGLLFTPFAIFLAWVVQKQFWTLFCCDPHETRALYGCFCSYGVLFAIFCLPAGLHLAIENEQHSSNDILFFFAVLVSWLFALIVGFANYADYAKRQKQFAESKEEEFESVIPTNYLNRYFTGVFSMVAISICGAFAMASTVPPVVGVDLHYEKIPYKELFPEEGSHFSYKRGYRGRLTCQFTIDEQGFRDWVAQQWEKPCQEIPEEDYRSPYGINPQTKKEESRSVTDGLYVDRDFDFERDCVFDRSTNTAYYY